MSGVQPGRPDPGRPGDEAAGRASTWARPIWPTACLSAPSARRAAGAGRGTSSRRPHATPGASPGRPPIPTCAWAAPALAGWRRSTIWSARPAPPAWARCKRPCWCCRRARTPISLCRALPHCTRQAPGRFGQDPSAAEAAFVQGLDAAERAGALDRRFLPSADEIRRPSSTSRRRVDLSADVDYKTIWFNIPTNPRSAPMDRNRQALNRRHDPVRAPVARTDRTRVELHLRRDCAARMVRRRGDRGRAMGGQVRLGEGHIRAAWSPSGSRRTS